jgi:hypothetical protein
MLRKKFLEVVGKRLSEIDWDGKSKEEFVEFTKNLSDDEIEKINNIAKKYTTHKDVYSIVLEYFRNRDLSNIEYNNKKDLEFYKKYLKDF